MKGGQTLESSNPTDKPILVSGMFDMSNFGDLLFPLVAAYRLGSHGFRVVPVSPTGRAAPLPDAIRSVAISEVMAGEVRAQGFLIGGGYIVHNHRMDFMRQYEDAGVAEWAGPGLWLGVSLASALQDVPVAWNAPGVPHPFARGQRPVIDAALRAADYVSLRDRGSLELLAPAKDIGIEIVPDPIADLGQMWPLASLKPLFADFLARKKGEPNARYAAFHFRNRSLAGLGAAGAAAALDEFARTEGVCPILLAVGHSHEDDVTARAISTAMQAAHLVLDDPLSLAEIAAVIGNSSVYIGASLHGYIAAAAYGVPGVLVALPAYRKFGGFLEHTQRLQDLAHGWREALEVAARHLRLASRVKLPASVLQALDRHWQDVVAALSDRSRGRRNRDDFMRICLQAGISVGGAGWAHLPLTRHNRLTKDRAALGPREIF